jgi:amidase
MAEPLDDLAFLSATEQAGLIRNRSISATELVSLYLARIARLNPVLNAFVTVAADAALRDAREADENLKNLTDPPPFYGVPIGIKDLIETAGIRTTYSSRLFADYVPSEDAAVIRRLRAAGFILVGKTNTPEFGGLSVTESELNGACRNPWDITLSPGGSSGGSAAAVASGMCPVALGTDDGGSVRIPASCCGLLGLKPSRGRISLGPRTSEGVNGYSVIGPIGRTVGDIAALLDVMEGYELGDAYWLPPPSPPFCAEIKIPPERLRIAVTSSTPTGANVHPECSAAANDVAALLSDLGHDVVEAAPEWPSSDIFGTLIQVWNPLVAYYLEEGDGRLSDSINSQMWQDATKESSIEYVRASQSLQRIARRLTSFWLSYDMLLTPTLGLPPVPIGWYFEEDIDPRDQFRRDELFVPFFTPLANITGLPSASVPLHWSSAGLPIGVQLTAGPAKEGILLRLLAQLEQARPWAYRRPPTT